MKKMVFATKKDLDGIKKVSTLAYQPHLKILTRSPRVLRMSDEDWLDLIEKEVVYVIKKQKRVIAVAVIQDRDKQYISISRVGVHPNYQGQGLGSFILLEAENIAQNKNKNISLATYGDYLPIVDFYRNRGYSIKDRRYRRGTDDEEILILHKILPEI